MWTSESTSGHGGAYRAGHRSVALATAAVLLLALLGVVDARAQPSHEPAEAQLERLLDVLRSWSQGKVLTRDEVEAVFSADADPRRSSETSCIRSVESDLMSYLEGSDPSLLPTLAFWQTQMLLESLDSAGLRSLRAVDFDRINTRLKTYRRRAARHVESLTRDEVDRNTALAWTGIAELFARRGSTAFYRSAEGVLREAVDIDDDLLPARYLLAWVGEKIHDPIDMVRPWRELLEAHPERVEYGLRMAINAANAARPGTALEVLPDVARSDGPGWVRVLAYEEWVQLLLESTDDDGESRAREVLEEARRELPGWPSLDLLASYLSLGSSRGEALRLAERVEAHVWPEQEVSPRLRYELPNPDEISPARAELIQLLKTGQRDLGAYLFVVDHSVLGSRSRRVCR